MLTLTSALFLSLAFARLFSEGVRFFAEPRVIAMGVIGGPPPEPEKPRPEPKGLRDRIKELGAGSFFRDRARARPSDPETGSERITLKGILAGSPAFARALIQTDRKGAPAAYGVSERVARFKILSIHSNSIMVSSGDSTDRRRLAIGDSIGTREGAFTDGTDDRDRTVSPDCGRDCRVVADRQKVCALGRDPIRIQMKNKFSPVIVNGRMEGVKLLSVASRDNFIFELGARAGDILRRINGQPLNNPRKLMSLFDSCETLTEIAVEIERGGRIVPRRIILK